MYTCNNNVIDPIFTIQFLKFEQYLGQYIVIIFFFCKYHYNNIECGRLSF